MTQKTRAAGLILVLLIVPLIVLAPAPAAAAPPAWLPGFPLRAGTSIILRWKPVPGATQYRVLRKLNQDDYKEIYAGLATIATDSGVAPSATVTYRIIAHVKGRESEPSATAVLKGLEPMKPPIFTGSIAGPGIITLRWSTPPGAAFFNIYRSDAKDGPYELLRSISQDTYTDRHVAKGKTYYYKVTAIDRNNVESDKSAPVIGRVPEEGPGRAAVEAPTVRKVVPKGVFFGEQMYELEQPDDLGFTPDGELFVLERKSVQFFDPDGQYRRRINFPKGWGIPGELVAAPDERFLVPFHAEHLLRKLDREGKEQTVIHYPPVPPNPLWANVSNNPNSVAIDPKGFFWVADGVRSQVLKIDEKGKVLKVIGRLQGSYDPATKTPSDLPGVGKIRWNPYDGKLYALLGPTAEIKVIDPARADVVRTFGGIGGKNHQFQGVGGIAFRKNGNILVLDHLMQVIKEFGPDYSYVATYADVVEREKIRLSSNFITNFAFLEDLGRFYITSTMGNRVYKFDIAN